jgi:4-amino-4-deoxy-L-arabinose transferase-like glycosyltransferase
VRRWLVVILVAGLVLRIAAHLDLATLPYFLIPQTDAGAYHDGARRIAAGDLALVDQVAGMGPGYFYFLGGVYALLGDGPFVIRAVQTLVGLGAVLCIFFAATRVLTPRASLLPAALAAAYAPSLFYESQLLGDGIALALHALALLLLLRARERRTAGRFFALGLVVGVAALFRPSALGLLLPIGVVALLRGDRSGLRAPAAFGVAVVGAALAIAPITARNVFLAREPVLITGHGGINLWLGNGPGATGAFRVPAEVPGAREPGAQYRAFRDVAGAALGHPASIAETDRYWTTRTVRYALAHPIDAFRVLARKLHLYWNGRELSDVYRYEFLRDRSVALQRLPGYLLVAPFALLGLLLAFRAPRDSAARALAWFALAEMIAIVAVLVSSRYRLVTLPPLFVFAGLGASVLVARLRDVDGTRTMRLRALAPLLAVLVAGVALAWPVRARPAVADGCVDLARVWLAVGDRDAARDAYAEALAADPTHPAAREGAAALAARLRRIDAQLHPRGMPRSRPAP